MSKFINFYSKCFLFYTQPLFFSDENFYKIEIPQGELLYYPNFLESAMGDYYLDYLLANDSYAWQQQDWRNTDPMNVAWQHIRWQQDRIFVYGKWHLTPRFSAWYGDEGKSYQYSGLRLEPHPWNEGLLALKTKIEAAANTRYNSVLLNWYRDGQDSMGWHADNEPELGKNPSIASLNLGTTRRFLMRRMDNPSEKLELPLHHGTLLIMQGEMQHYWHHAVPKETKIKANRINLTFRTII